MAGNSKEEPKTGPQSDRWYNLTLGSSFKDDSSNKYCTLRCNLLYLPTRRCLVSEKMLGESEEDQRTFPKLVFEL